MKVTTVAPRSDRNMLVLIALLTRRNLMTLFDGEAEKPLGYSNDS
jgi:hypothetical protein